MTFLAALPTGPVCPVGSGAVYEFVRPDALGFNLRTMWDAVEVSRMVEAGGRSRESRFLCAAIARLRAAINSRDHEPHTRYFCCLLLPLAATFPLRSC